MSFSTTLIRSSRNQDILRTGLCIGLAGGLAEIVVVWLYSVATGGDAALLARAVAAAVGLSGASAATGVAVHMALAGMIGVGLAAVLRVVAGKGAPDRVVFPFMLGSLAAVWAVNFFVLLPAISPGFVHLLPYALTLASKLAFGLAAAAAVRGLSQGRA